MVKNPPAMQETWVQSLGQEDPMEEGMATHSSVLAWDIPWTEESDRKMCFRQGKGAQLGTSYASNAINCGHSPIHSWWMVWSVESKWFHSYVWHFGKSGLKSWA